MILVAGEALFDLIAPLHADSKMSAADGGLSFEGHAGGSPFNCALALGRLKAPVKFANMLSNDFFGDCLSQCFDDADVSLLIPKRTEMPTPLAVVTNDDRGVPSYRFYFRGTSFYENLKLNLSDYLPSDLQLLHLGSLALMDQSSARFWLPVAKDLCRQGIMISIDPNVRDTMVDDMQEYRRCLEDFWPLSSVVKISDEDLMALYPDQQPQQSFERIVKEFKPKLGVLTQGDKGSLALTATGLTVSQTAWQVTGIKKSEGDTVGAGDCFHAGLLASLYEQGLLDSDKILSINRHELDKALILASRVAGINCSRRGCHPPTRDEVMANLAENPPQAGKVS